MKHVLKTAVIGVGTMGSNHARVLSEISDLVAVCDADATKARLVAKRHKAQPFEDYKHCLKIMPVDAVVIAVPTKHHYQIAKYCLEVGIPCLVEKPLTETVAQGQELLKLSKSLQLVLVPGHIERFNPVVIELKKLIDQGALGKIVSLLSMRLGINPPQTKGADVAVDLGIHDVDIFQYLLGETASEIVVLKHKVVPHNVADAAHIMLKFAGATGMIQTNWITPQKTRYLYVTGTKGMAKLDYINQTLQYTKGDRSRDTADDFLALMTLSETPWQTVLVKKREPLKLELAFFLQSVLRSNILATSLLCQDVLSALKLVTNTR